MHCIGGQRTSHKVNTRQTMGSILRLSPFVFNNNTSYLHPCARLQLHPRRHGVTVDQRSTLFAARRAAAAGGADDEGAAGPGPPGVLQPAVPPREVPVPPGQAPALPPLSASPFGRGVKEGSPPNVRSPRTANPTNLPSSRLGGGGRGATGAAGRSLCKPRGGDRDRLRGDYARFSVVPIFLRWTNCLQTRPLPSRP